MPELEILKEKLEVMTSLVRREGYNENYEEFEDRPEDILSAEELKEWGEELKEEQQRFNVNINSIDLENSEAIAPFLVSYLKNRLVLNFLYPEWTPAIHSWLIYKSQPKRQEIENWVSDLEEHITKNYAPLMKMCRDKIGFENDKEILKRDLKLKLEKIYLPYVKNDKFFTTTTANLSENKAIFSENQFDTGENLSSYENIDLGKIAWVNNLLEEFKHERIKILDRYFYWVSFF